MIKPGQIDKCCYDGCTDKIIAHWRTNRSSIRASTPMQGLLPYSIVAVLNLWSVDNWWSADIGLMVREQRLLFHF